MTMQQRNKVIRANIETSRASADNEERYHWEHVLWLGMRPSMKKYSIEQLQERIATAAIEHNIMTVCVKTGGMV